MIRNRTSGSSPDLAGGCGPADHRRQRAGGAADDDVVRRAPLQPGRVDHDVEEDREGEQPGRHQVRGERQHDDAAGGKDEPERERFALPDPAAGQRPPRRACHDGVDVGVVPHVEHAGGSGSCRDGEDGKARAQRGEIAGRNGEADDRGEDGEHHHPGLRQGDEVGQPAALLRDEKGGACHRLFLIGVTTRHTPWPPRRVVRRELRLARGSTARRAGR